MKSRPSSSCTCFKNAQRRQSISFLAYVPCVFPSQRVPATAQQNLPQCLPLLTPSKYSLGNAAGHTPSFSAFSPPGCLPHFFTFQQFRLSIIGPSLWIKGITPELSGNANATSEGATLVYPNILHPMKSERISLHFLLQSTMNSLAPALVEERCGSAPTAT
jgi:hypothetical protein